MYNVIVSKRYSQGRKVFDRIIRQNKIFLRPVKSGRSKVSAAAIIRLTSDIKRLMTTALDGGKLMGEILSRQFIESNPILAMMYTFTYILPGKGL